MKKSKIIVKFVSILLLVNVFVGCLSACSSSPFTDENTQVFFNKIARLAKEDSSKIKVNECVGYFHNNLYYYDIQFDFHNKYEQKWQNCDNVYVYAGSLYDAMFNKHNGQELFPSNYERYLIAKEEGDKKIFIKEEIDRYLNNFFDSISQEE